MGGAGENASVHARPFWELTRVVAQSSKILADSADSNGRLRRAYAWRKNASLFLYPNLDAMIQKYKKDAGDLVTFAITLRQ